MARFKVKILLEDMHIPVSSLPLEGEYTIRDCTSDDLRTGQRWIPDHEYTLLLNQHRQVKVLQKEYDIIDPSNLGELQQKQRNLQTVLLALRLIKSGTLGYRVSTWESQEELGENAPLLQSFYSPDQMAWGEGEYRLDEDDIVNLQGFWADNRNRLLRVKELGAMQIAISRFEMSYGKYAHVDKFLDLMIAMEALYLTGNEQMEMSYRMSQRAALMLESDPDKRIELRKQIKKLYGIRSKLVHGGSLRIEAAGRGESEIVLELKEYVRSSIKKLLPRCEDAQSIDRQIDKLDKAALSYSH